MSEVVISLERGSPRVQRETRTCGILRKPRADLLLLTDFHILPRAPTQSGTPRTAEEFVIFSQSGSMGKNVSDKGT